MLLLLEGRRGPLRTPGIPHGTESTNSIRPRYCWGKTSPETWGNFADRPEPIMLPCCGQNRQEVLGLSPGLQCKPVQEAERSQMSCSKQQRRGLSGSPGSSGGGGDEGEDWHGRGGAVLAVRSLKAPALTSSKAAPGRRAGVQEPFSPPPLKGTDAWVGSPRIFCARCTGTRLWTTTALQGEAGAAGRRNRTGTTAAQDKTNTRPSKAQHRKPHLKFSAGRDGVKVFPCVKRGWLAGTVLAGMALFWSAERG